MKTIKVMRKVAKKAGWTVKICKGHLRWIPPSGKNFVVSASTPSDKRALLNLRARLRRRGLDI